MSKTIREKFMAALLARGETEVKRTFRYIVYSRQAGGHYYLGSNGGLRYGATIAGSVPVSQKFKDLLLGATNVPTTNNIQNRSA